MKRRDAVCGFLAIVATPWVRAQSRGKVHRVGFVATTSPLAEISGPDPANRFVRAFVNGLRDLGYLQGKNLALEMRSLEGKPERLEAIVADFVRLNTDVIFLPSSPLIARVRKVAPSTPIVGLVIASQVVSSGLAQSIARPGGTVTGLSIDVDEQLEAKRLELLLELAPRATRVAYLGTREQWERPYILKMRAAAQRLGVSVVHAETGNRDFASAFSRLRLEQADAFVVERSSRAYGRRQQIGRRALASGIPGSCAQGELVDEGCLMSYGPDNNDLARRAALYVDKVLKGAKPGDLAIEAPSKFELMINAKTAKALGLSIPPSIQLRADRVIE